MARIPKSAKLASKPALPASAEGLHAKIWTL
jgi:hypothetical protein